MWRPQKAVRLDRTLQQVAQTSVKPPGQTCDHVGGKFEMSVVDCNDNQQNYLFRELVLSFKIYKSIRNHRELTLKAPLCGNTSRNLHFLIQPLVALLQVRGTRSVSVRLGRRAYFLSQST